MNPLIKNIKKIFYRLRGQASLHIKNTKLSPSFLITNMIEAEKILSKDNEEKLLEIFLNEVQPGDIVLDIGANIGLYTLPSVLKMRGQGTVFAFEPAPLWFNRLEENIRLNHFSSHQVMVYNIGLANKNEVSELVMKRVTGSGMGSITGNYRDFLKKKHTEVISVPLAEGDDFLLKEKIPPPDIVKIDVEGAELAVLQGLEKSLRQPNCRFILCEVHQAFMTDPPESVQNLLMDYGFSCQITEKRQSEFFLLGRRVDK